MSAMLKDHPTLLVWAWTIWARILLLLRSLFRLLGFERSSRVVRVLEWPLKSLLFGCQMCGQCVLHRTGMTCPMTCPKLLRNGPCGGVRLDGSCEVEPARACVWVKAVERAQRTVFALEILRLNPPLDCRLRDHSSWVTYALGRDRVTMSGDPAMPTAADILESP